MWYKKIISQVHLYWNTQYSDVLKFISITIVDRNHTTIELAQHNYAFGNSKNIQPHSYLPETITLIKSLLSLNHPPLYY